jgi:hypothetical protein
MAIDPSDCDGIAAADFERVKRFITDYAERSGWTFAKTMPDKPHEYAVRARSADLGKEHEFVWVVQAIREHGYKRKFGSTTYTYLNVDGGRYWTMGNPLPETTILNRAPLTLEGQEELRRANGLTNTRWFDCGGHRYAVIVEQVPDLDALCCPVCGQPNTTQPRGDTDAEARIESRRLA